MEKSKHTGVNLALGSFDGLHIGHMKVLRSALSSGGRCVVPLFDTNPKTFLTGKKMPLIMPSAHVKSELEKLGFEVDIISFSEIHTLSPSEFFEKIIIGKYSAGTVSCGFNYTFGRAAGGSSEDLERYCKKSGIKAFVSPPVMFEGSPVSSTRIREALFSGEIKKANAMLGRPFAYEAEVVHGDARGALLGFPTANQLFADDMIIPKNGIYESAVTIDGKKYKSITNIGIRPTYPLDRPISETHIIDFKGNLYSQMLRVELMDFLREEMLFNSADELVEQLNKDLLSVKGAVK